MDRSRQKQQQSSSSSNGGSSSGKKTSEEFQRAIRSREQTLGRQQRLGRAEDEKLQALVTGRVPWSCKALRAKNCSRYSRLESCPTSCCRS
jgi:hypothetical protein